MISFCNCPSEGSELLPKSNFRGFGKYPLPRSPEVECSRGPRFYIWLLSESNMHCAGFLVQPRGIISTSSRPVHGIHQSCNARHIVVWVYGLCQVVAMGTMSMVISWD